VIEVGEAAAPGERVVVVPTAIVAAGPCAPGVPIATEMVEGTPSMVMSSELGMLGMG
jgi:hypothetical protein